MIKTPDKRKHFIINRWVLSPEGVSQSDFSGSLFETASSLLGGIIKSDNEKFKVVLIIFCRSKNRKGNSEDLSRRFHQK
jgi:hypothetical protein